MTENSFEISEVKSTPESCAERRAKIMALESEMFKLPQVTIETKHHFGPGIYMREIFIPAGVMLTGYIHKTEHYNILSLGRLKLVTEDGSKEVAASTVILSKPGVKRAAVALEDSVWITVHHNPTNERDVKKLEDMLVTNSYEKLEASKQLEQIGRDTECLS